MTSSLRAALLLLSLAPAASAQAGEVLRSTLLAPGVGGVTGPDEPQHLFGQVLASLGDLDGDGVGDLAVGDWLNETVYVLFLKPDGTAKGEVELSLPSRFHSLAGLGDLGGDGTLELAVGLYGETIRILSLTALGTVASEVEIVRGAGGFQAPIPVEPEALGCLGDVDGDGIADLGVGYPDSRSKGAFWVLFLNADGSVRTFARNDNTHGEATIGNIHAGARFGHSVTSVGPFNGDGLTWVAVGGGHKPVGGTYAVPGFRMLGLDANGVARKQVVLRDGSAALPPGMLPRFDPYGSACTVGDLDGDGLDDLVVGCGDDLAWVLFLKADARVRAAQRIEPRDLGYGATNWFSRGLADLGDLDGDGTREVAIGSDGPQSVSVTFLSTGSFQPPVADFVVERSLPQNPGYRTLHFGDRSQNNVWAWEWDLGDGVTFQHPYPSLAFELDGNLRDVSLTVTGAAGSSTVTETRELTAAAAAIRNGSGVNVPCLNADPPHLGQTPLLVIDPSAGAAQAVSLKLALAHALPASGQFFRGWEILVDLGSERYWQLVDATDELGPSSYALPAPPLDPAFVGLPLTLQAGYIEPAGLVLCNAVDLTAGW